MIPYIAQKIRSIRNRSASPPSPPLSPPVPSLNDEASFSDLQEAVQKFGSNNDVLLSVIKGESTFGIPTYSRVPKEDIATVSGFYCYVYEGIVDDAKADSFRWKNNSKKRNGDIEKVFYSCLNAEKKADKRFTRNIITVDGYNRSLISYNGESNIAGRKLPHGNDKKSSRTFQATPKHTLDAIKDKVRSGQPSRVYKDTIARSSNLSSESTPRDLKQVQNAKHATRNETRVSTDEQANLFALGTSALAYFIAEMTVLPDIFIILSLPGLFDIFLELLKCHAMEILTSYDTTFQCGKFWVSIFAVRFPFLEENPTIPLFWVLHESKFKEVHLRFFQFLETLLCRTTRAKLPMIPIVTDEEYDLAGFQYLKHLLCCNQIKSQI